MVFRALREMNGRTSPQRSSPRFCQREGAPSPRMKIVEDAGCSRLLRGLWLPFIGSTAAIDAIKIPQRPLAFFGALLEYRELSVVTAGSALRRATFGGAGGG